MPAKKVRQALRNKWKPNPALDDAESHRHIVDFTKSKNFSDQDYKDVLVGKYEHIHVNGRYWRGDIPKAIYASKHNNAKNNDEILEYLYKDLRTAGGRDVDPDDIADRIKGMAKFGNLSQKAFSKFTTDVGSFIPDYYNNSKTVPVLDVLKNPNASQEYLYKMAQSFPKETAGHLLNHEKADDRLHDILINDDIAIKNIDPSDLRVFISSKTNEESGTIDINPNHAMRILNHSGDKLYEDSFHRIMAGVDEDARRDYIDRKLGIKGGDWLHTPPDDSDTFNDENWDNWKPGSDYNEEMANRLADSKYLDDTQADHIKRHGNFEQKIQLYHNKDIDPKHGAEMFKLWHDNENHKGYIAEQLNKYNQDYKRRFYTVDDVPEEWLEEREDDIYESAREDAEENYSFNDYIYDNSEDLVNRLEEDDFGDNFADNVYETLHDRYDWEEDNPNHDSGLQSGLDKVLKQYRDEDKHRFHLDELKKIFGEPTVEQLDLAENADEDGEVEIHDIKDIFDEHNPEQINYTDHNELTINDHPDFEERFTEAANSIKEDILRDRPYDFYDNFYEDYMESDAYLEAEKEARENIKEYIAGEYYKEHLFPTSHQDPRFVPEHLVDHVPGLKEAIERRKQIVKEGPYAPFINQHIPNKSFEHSYGTGQAQLELLQDYSEANGGSIDQGRMHKIFPNLKETWKGIFAGKGKLSSDEIGQKIEELPKTKYDVSYGKWAGDKMQNVNERDQIIFRLDHSDESLKPLQEDEDLFDSFQKVQRVSKQSGHPTNDRTIAWARVDTTDPNHWMIDEVQSDFGKTVTRYLKEQGAEDKSDHIKKISDYHKDWREALINHVVNTAKTHGASKVSTHSPDSKSSHTGADTKHSVYNDSYKKVPRKMGFKASKAADLPLTDKSRSDIFKKVQSFHLYNLANEHKWAWDHHSNMGQIMSSIANSFPDHSVVATEYANQHRNLAEEHKERALGYTQAVKAQDKNHKGYSEKDFIFSTNIDHDERKAGLQSAKTGEFHGHDHDPSLNKPMIENKNEFHEGHTLDIKPQIKKAWLGFANDLIKYEHRYGFIFKDESIKPDFQVTKQPKFDLPHVDASAPNMVHADYHGFGGNMHNDDQRKLIHGIDTDTAKPVDGVHLNTAGSQWHTNSLTNKKAIVKPASGVGEGKGSIQKKLGHIDTRGFNGPRREVMFHNMAHKFFDMGSHIPTTAGYTRRGEDYSVQAHVDAHPLNEHGYKTGSVPKPVEDQLKSALKSHHEDGSLHKLAMMDFIMGNHDRHRGNYMLGRHDNKLHMIDNSLAFDYDNKTVHPTRGLAPSYLIGAEYHGISGEPHPEAVKWLNSLDEKRAVQMWKDHGFESDHSAVQGFVNRIHNLKGNVNLYLKNKEKQKPSIMSRIMGSGQLISAKKLSNLIDSAGKHNKKVDWSQADTETKIED